MSNIFGLTCISSDPGYEGWIFAKHPDGSNWVTCAKMTPETWAMIQPAMAKAESFGAEISEMPIEDLRFCVTIQRIEIDRLRAELAAERERAEALTTERDGLIDSNRNLASTCKAYKDERDTLRTELASVLGDWNALVAAIGSPTNGGAIGHAKALRAENERLIALAQLGRWCLDESRQNESTDVDAASLQDKAIALGLLEHVPVSKPCAEDYCQCAEYYASYEWPASCLRYTDRAALKEEQ